MTKFLKNNQNTDEVIKITTNKLKEYLESQLKEGYIAPQEYNEDKGFSVDVWQDENDKNIIHMHTCIRPISDEHRDYLLANGWNEGCTRRKKNEM
jgi:hypothetical protein